MEKEKKKVEEPKYNDSEQQVEDEKTFKFRANIVAKKGGVKKTRKTLILTIEMYANYAIDM